MKVIKDENYWNEIHEMAEEVGRLSTEVQGPLIEKYVDQDVTDMSIEDITNHISQFYDEDARLAWDALEVRGTRVSEDYGVDPTELSRDLWAFIAESSTQADQVH